LLRDGSSFAGSDGGKEGKKEEEEEEKVNLDKFLANHTSEDNESFKEIQEEAFKRHQYVQHFKSNDSGAVVIALHCTGTSEV
jgi:hypothetical protein